jgi:hypothetical protein
MKSNYLNQRVIIIMVGLSFEQINDIKEEMNTMHNLLYQLENQVKTVRQIINKKKDYLMKNCNHNKQIDYNSCSEHTEYICSKCGMYL